MNRIALDNEYQVVSPSGIYEDDFTEIVDAVFEAKERGEISRDEAEFLIALALRKHIGGEVEDMFWALEHRKPDLEAQYFRVTTNNGRR